MAQRDLAVRVRPVTLISEGRRGQVFIGIDALLRRRVIVKKLASHAFESTDTRRRIIDEARVMAQIDHPNLVRIHDYSERDGHDIFTLECTDGKKLSDALADGLTFAEKVRVATAVASALAVVHRNGILHGPLSLDSVVVAKDEIKVVDFRSTSTNLDGPTTLSLVRSPEELRGEEPTTASDMYSFGFLLKAMFGNGDHDVRALIASLVREAPSERPTVATVLETLHRLARRHVRRIRVVAVASAIALALFGVARYTIDLRHAKSEAVMARAEAEARRAKANELVALLIEDLHPKLESVGRLDILDAVDAKALQYFASIEPDEISPREVAVNVTALSQLGDTQLKRVNLDGSLKTLRQAVRTIDAAVRRRPDDEMLLLSAAGAHSSLNAALLKNGDTVAAMEEVRALSRYTAELVRRKPNEVRYLMWDAAAHGTLASMLDRTEEIAAALRENQIAAAMKERALRLSDSDEAWIDLSISRQKTGLALFKLGRFDESVAQFADLRRILDAVGARRPGDKTVLDKSVLWHREMATVSLARGDVDSAARYAAGYLAESEQLTTHDPANLEWRQHLGIAHRLIGTTARMRGDINAALRNHERAVDILNGMFGHGQRTLIIDRELALSRIELARSLLAAHRNAAASGQADLVVQAFQTSRQELPAQKILCEALLVQGEARRGRGDFAGATVAWEDALDLLTPLGARSPDPRIADTNARVLLSLGRGESAQVLVQRLAAIGYRNREYEAARSRQPINQPTKGLKEERK